MTETETFIQYTFSSASGPGTVAYDWLPDAWKEARLRRMEVSAVMRNINIGPPNPAYTCGAQVLFAELNNGIPIMEVAMTNAPASINGNALVVTHWFPWQGNLRLDGGLQYSLFLNAFPLFEMTNPADWEFLLTVHWQIQMIK